MLLHKVVTERRRERLHPILTHSVRTQCKCTQTHKTRTGHNWLEKETGNTISSDIQQYASKVLQAMMPQIRGEEQLVDVCLTSTGCVLRIAWVQVLRRGEERRGERRCWGSYWLWAVFQLLVAELDLWLPLVHTQLPSDGSPQSLSSGSPRPAAWLSPGEERNEHRKEQNKRKLC